MGVTDLWEHERNVARDLNGTLGKACMSVSAAGHVEVTPKHRLLKQVATMLCKTVHVLQTFSHFINLLLYVFYLDVM